LAASGWTYALAGPTNLAALTVSSVQVNLTWTDACRNEAGFRIERSTDNVTYGVIAWLAANSTSFAAGALTPSTRYYFRVRGYLTSTQLSAPIGASAVTQAVVTPPAPSNLAAARYSVSRIDLSWKDNASNEDGFVLQKSTGSGTWSQVATLVANLTSYSVTGLAMGVTYSYRICAYNARGNSIWSNTSSAMTYPMYAPISPVATALSVSRIQVTWVDRADNESGYAIERSTNGTSFTQVATVAANTTSYTVSGLTAGTRYYYRVRGWTSLGYSGYSAIVSATTPAAAAPFSLQTVAYSFSDGDPLLDQQQVQ
jgi:titin